MSKTTKIDHLRIRSPSTVLIVLNSCKFLNHSSAIPAHVTRPRGLRLQAPAQVLRGLGQLRPLVHSNNSSNRHRDNNRGLANPTIAKESRLASC